MKIDICVTESELQALKDYIQFHTTVEEPCVHCADCLGGTCNSEKRVACVKHATYRQKCIDLDKAALPLRSNPVFNPFIAAYKEYCNKMIRYHDAMEALKRAEEQLANELSKITVVEDEDA